MRTLALLVAALLMAIVSFPFMALAWIISPFIWIVGKFETGLQYIRLGLVHVSSVIIEAANSIAEEIQR